MIFDLILQVNEVQFRQSGKYRLNKNPNKEHLALSFVPEVESQRLVFVEVRDNPSRLIMPCLC